MPELHSAGTALRAEALLGAVCGICGSFSCQNGEITVINSYRGGSVDGFVAGGEFEGSICNIDKSSVHLLYVRCLERIAAACDGKFPVLYLQPVLTDDTVINSVYDIFPAHDAKVILARNRVSMICVDLKFTVPVENQIRFAINRRGKCLVGIGLTVGDDIFGIILKRDRHTIALQNSDCRTIGTRDLKAVQDKPYLCLLTDIYCERAVQISFKYIRPRQCNTDICSVACDSYGIFVDLDVLTVCLDQNRFSGGPTLVHVAGLESGQIGGDCRVSEIDGCRPGSRTCAVRSGAACAVCGGYICRVRAIPALCSLCSHRFCRVNCLHSFISSAGRASACTHGGHYCR